MMFRLFKIDSEFIPNNDHTIWNLENGKFDAF